MKLKQIFKMIIDITMTALLFVLMAYHITGNRLHEWLGIILILLFIIHHVLNLKWYGSLFKGKYTVFRSFMTAVNVMLFFAMAGMAVSGILLSREVFGFLDIRGGMFGRRLHMVSTAWGFCLMAVHIGLHLGMVIGMANKVLGKGRQISKPVRFLMRLLPVLVSIYGIYAFIARGIVDRMFLLAEYAFFDYEESALLFFADYASILIVFATVSYYLSVIIRQSKTAKQTGNRIYPYFISLFAVLAACGIIPLSIKYMDMKNNKESDIGIEDVTEKDKTEDEPVWPSAQVQPEPAGEQKSKYKDGVYQGSGKGFGGAVEVELEIKNGKITSAKVLSAKKETKQFLNKAETLLQDVVEKQDGGVDAVSGATYSSNGILEGVQKALAQAE